MEYVHYPNVKTKESVPSYPLSLKPIPLLTDGCASNHWSSSGMWSSRQGTHWNQTCLWKLQSDIWAKKKWHRSSWDCMIVDFYSDKLLSCWKWYIHDCRVLQERKNCVLHTVTSCSLVEQTSWSSCVFSMKRSIRLFMTWCWTHQRLQKGTVKLFACLVKCAEKPLIDLYWSKGYSIIKYTNDIVTEMKTKNVGMDSSSFTFIF